MCIRDRVVPYRQIRRVANMSQIRDKKAHRKHIATMTPINAKSVQLIEPVSYTHLDVYKRQGC